MGPLGKYTLGQDLAWDDQGQREEECHRERGMRRTGQRGS